MVKKCTVCLSTDVKETLKEAFPEMTSLLTKVKDCTGEKLADFCISKRKSNPRMQFMSKCMKEQNIQGFQQASKAMQKCSAEWKSSGQSGKSVESEEETAPKAPRKTMLLN